jgi:hypothetical protein
LTVDPVLEAAVELEHRLVLQDGKVGDRQQ